MTKTKVLTPPLLDIDKVLYKDREGLPHPNGVLERRIVWNLIAYLDAKGFGIIRVDEDGQKHPVMDAKAAMEIFFNLDEACFVFAKKEKEDMYIGGGSPKEHWILLIAGNGIDIVSDYGIPKIPNGFDEAMSQFDGEEFA